MDELLTSQDIHQHAKKIRSRLQELYEQFDLTLPVYMVFTKTDLLAGFGEFFDDLNKDDRSQVWGTTFTADNKAIREPLSQLESELDLLESSLKAKRILKLEKEIDLERRKNIYVFPEQFRSIKNSVNSFVGEVFAPSRYQHKILLRGVYFTSAEQTGSPIDKLLGSIARTFGLEHGLPSGNTRRGKSFFIDDLLKKVVFTESELAGLSPKYEKKQKIYRWGVISSAVLFLGVGSGLWLISFLNNNKSITYASNAVAELQKTITDQGEKVGAGELSDSLSIVNQARSLTISDETLLSTLGLSQREKLETRSQKIYHDSLQIELLPHVVQALETKLKDYQSGETSDSDLLNALKAYLILAPSKDSSYLDYYEDNKSLIMTYMDSYAVKKLSTEGMELLKEHLLHLINDIIPRPSLSKAGLGIQENLVNMVRSHLLDNDINSIVFEQVKSEVSLKTSNLKDFAIGSGSKGPVRNAERVFMRRSGEPMTSGINGIFTYDGFKAYERYAQQSIRSFLKDDWVLGESLNTDQEMLRETLADSYFSEFQKEWEVYLKDFKIIKPTSLNHAGQIFKELQKSNSPLNEFLKLIAVETHLTKPESANSAEGLISRTAKVAERQAIQVGGRTVSSAIEIAGGDAINKLTSLRANPDQDDPITLEFEDLRSLSDEASPDLEQLQQALLEVSTHLNSLQGHLPAESRAEVMRKLKLGMENMRDTANTLPDPVNLWILDFLRDINSLIQNKNSISTDNSWEGQVYSEYSDKIKGRFPLSNSSRREVPLGDFADFFGPNGVLDQYINNDLRGAIDTTGKTWRSTGSFTTISSKSLRQLQIGDKIKNSFFPKNSSGPKVSFKIKVIRSSPNMAGVILVIDGQRLNFSKGGSTSNVKMEWPGPAGTGDIILDMLVNGQRQRIEVDGSWSIVKFAAQGRIKALSGGNRFDLTFVHSTTGETVSFRISTDRSDNLFNSLKELKSFRLPAKLVN
jgi:type VI secretion system protein ImpL